MAIKGVIFDLDGTLLDTLPDLIRVINGELLASGYPARTPEEFNHIIGGGIQHALRIALPDWAPDEAVGPLFERYFASYSAHCCEETRHFDGMEATLRALSARGVALAVLTNKTEELAVRIVRHYFPDIPFRFVWGQCAQRPLKPDPGAGVSALEKLGLRPEEVAFVGDSGDTDMAFAVACGMLPVGAVWGYRGREELLACGAVKLAARPADLLTLL